MLNTNNSGQIHFIDNNLPLFGRNSVLGRSVVIKGSANIQCIISNIYQFSLDYKHPKPIVGLATFTGPVIGYVLFRQLSGSSFEDTSVFVQLSYSNGQANATTGHKVTISSSDNCEGTAQSFNPYFINSVNYNTECSSLNPSRCYVGDLSEKYGADFIVYGPNAFYIDVNLPLHGKHNVLHKAVTLSAANNNSSIVSCAKLLPLKPLIAVSKSHLNNARSIATFTQSDGILRTPTFIELHLDSHTSFASIHIDNHPMNGRYCSEFNDVYSTQHVSTNM